MSIELTHSVSSSRRLSTGESDEASEAAGRPSTTTVTVTAVTCTVSASTITTTAQVVRSDRKPDERGAIGSTPSRPQHPVVTSCPSKGSTTSTTSSTNSKRVVIVTNNNVLNDQISARTQLNQTRPEPCQVITSSAASARVDSSRNKMELVELSRVSGQEHRELPVDVPDTFVGVVKQQPRYPPTKPTVAPGHSAAARPDADKLKKYQAEVTKKKAEEEFLRSSLRGSKKLQQLEQKQRFGEAVDNAAFEPDQVDSAASGELSKGEKTNTIVSASEVMCVTACCCASPSDAHANSRAAGHAASPLIVCMNILVVPLADLDAIVQRISTQLNGEIKEILERSKIAKLVTIYKTVMEQKQRLRSVPNVDATSCDLVQEIITMLQEEVITENA